MNHRLVDESVSSVSGETLFLLRVICKLIRVALTFCDVIKALQQRDRTLTNFYANQNVAKAYHALVAVGPNFSAIARLSGVCRNTLMESTADEWIQFRKDLERVKAQRRRPFMRRRLPRQLL